MDKKQTRMETLKLSSIIGGGYISWQVLGSFLFVEWARWFFEAFGVGVLAFVVIRIASRIRWYFKEPDGNADNTAQRDQSAEQTASTAAKREDVGGTS